MQVMPPDKTFWTNRVVVHQFEIISNEKSLFKFWTRYPGSVVPLAMFTFYVPAEVLNLTGASVTSNQQLVIILNDQWTNVPMDQWTKGLMDQWTDVPTDRWTNGPIDQRTDGPTDRWTNGPTEGQSLLYRCVDASKKNYHGYPMKSMINLSY